MATLVLMPVAGFVTGRLIQPEWLIMTALAGTGWSLWRSSGLDLDIAFWDLSMVRVTQVVWLPFVFIPLSAVSYVGVPPHRTNEASAIINLMRNLGGSVGVSFTTTMLQERLQFHHEQLSEHVTAYNGYGWNSPLPSIDSVVQAKAGIMSYLDIFWVLGLLGLAIWPLALLLPRMPRGAGLAH
jgi:DHA2 family multidrug resistance protein